MTATPVSFPPRPTPSVEQLQAIADTAAGAAEAFDDDDYRVYFLEVLDNLDWTSTDNRWRSALDMLRHDEPTADPLASEARGLLVQITAGTQDMLDVRGERSDRPDLQQESRELRAAIDRLSSIVHAVTAVHSVGSVAS